MYIIIFREDIAHKYGISSIFCHYFVTNGIINYTQIQRIYLSYHHIARIHFDSGLHLFVNLQI